MTFTNPGWLWLMALAVPIVVLHLRMRRKVRVVVPSLLAFDPQALGEASPRAAGLRPRDLAGLLLELSALGALSLAAAGPVEGSESASPKPLAIVLDGSCSTMAAGRFEEMRGLARRALDSVGSDTPATLLLAAGEVRVLADAAAPRAAVEKALADAKPRVVGAGALAPAADMAASAGAEVLVLTDGCDRDAPGLAAREGVRVVSVGKPERNRAVVGYSVELRRPWGGSLYLRVREEDGRVVDQDMSREFQAFLQERRPAEDPAEIRWFREGWLGLRKREDPPVDALPEDDVIPLWDLPLGPVLVEVRTASGKADPYLAAALEACGDVVGPTAHWMSGSHFDVAICGPGTEEAEKPRLSFGAGTGNPLDAPVVQPGDRLHPVMRGVDPAEWIVTRGRTLEARAGDSVLLNGPSGPLALAGTRSGVRCVLLGFDPVESTIPLSGSWPVFLRNALLWLGEETRPSGSGRAPGMALLDAEESDLSPRVPRNAEAFVPPTRAPRGSGPRSRAADFAGAGAILLLLEWALFALLSAPSGSRPAIAPRGA